MIGINHRVETCSLQHLELQVNIAGRHANQRHLGPLQAKLPGELQDFQAILLAAVDHDAIRPRLDVRQAPRHRLFHAAIQDQAFTPGNHHQPRAGATRTAGLKLGAKGLDGLLRLVNLDAQE